MTSSTKKAAMWIEKGNKWGQQAIETAQGISRDVNSPFVNTIDVNAFGLKGKHPVTADYNQLSQRDAQQRQNAINAGLGANLSPEQNKAMQQYLGQQLAVDNSSYLNEIARRRAAAEGLIKAEQGLYGLGLKGRANTINADMNATSAIINNKIESMDAYTQARLAEQQRKDQERSGLLGLAGVLTSAGINSYQSRQPTEYDNYGDKFGFNQSGNVFDTPYQSSPYDLGFGFNRN